MSEEIKDNSPEPTKKDTTNDNDIKDNTEQLRKEQEQEEKKEIFRVIAGHNDVFKEDYKFDEIEIEFTIKLKFPSLTDQARVKAVMEQMFGGFATLMNPQSNAYKAYYMLATIEHQINKYGVDTEEVYIPKLFRNTEEVYNPFILATIYDDYMEWRNRFQY